MKIKKTIIEQVIKQNYLNKKPVFIMYVSVYFQNSAGIMAQYKLAEDLQKNGYIVFGVLWDEWIRLNNNFVEMCNFQIYHNIVILPKKFAIQMCEKYNCIAIYTDHDIGNKDSFNAKVVGRWLGYRPGKLGQCEFHDTNEKIFGFCKCFSNYQHNPESCGELTIYPQADELSKLFNYDSGIQKKLISIYTGKKQFKSGYIDKYDVLITRDYPNNKNDLAKILKATNILYSFDSCTALLYEALLCGCIVIIIDHDKIYTRDDLLMSVHGTTGQYIYGDKIDYSIDRKYIADTVLQNIRNINYNYVNMQLPFFIKILLSNFKDKYQ